MEWRSVKLVSSQSWMRWWVLARAGNAGARCEYEQTGVSRHLGGQPAGSSTWPHLNHLLHHPLKSDLHMLQVQPGHQQVHFCNNALELSRLSPLISQLIAWTFLKTWSRPLHVPPSFFLFHPPSSSFSSPTFLLLGRLACLWLEGRAQWPAPRWRFLSMSFFHHSNFKLSHTDAVGLIQNTNIPTATRLPND